MKKINAKIQQAASKLYSEETIMDKAENGKHDGEDYKDIFQKIMLNPNIEHEAGDNGVTNMKMNGELIGWYDASRGIGNIDQKAYDKIKDMQLPEPDRELPYDEPDDDYDEPELDDFNR
jgi:hypothetical protein